MDILAWLLPLLALFTLFDILLLRFLKKRKRLSASARQKIEHNLQKIQSLPLKEQIFEYDKLLDFCLQQRGLEGSLGEKMKRCSEFQNTNAIWNAHKLRNKLAHEIGFAPPENECTKAAKDFQREIQNFLA